MTRGSGDRRPRLVLVVNLHAHGAGMQRTWRRAEAAFTAAGDVCGLLETCGDGGDAGRIEALVGERRPDIVVAAGGDGTVNEVAAGILRSSLPTPPALAIVPLGTGNNVARGLGLESCRVGGESATSGAVRTAVAGAERCVDVGEANGCHFLGSFATGMDADILRVRNRLRARLRLRGAAGGYALYLGSCALNLLRAHGAGVRLRADGTTAQGSARLYNLLVLNTPIYAGEFRFTGPDSFDDGQLEMLLFNGPLAYLRGYPRAWRRHVRQRRGHVVHPDRTARRVREVEIELARPLACQIDGEEVAPADRYTVRVLPRRLTVKVPGPATAA